MENADERQEIQFNKNQLLLSQNTSALGISSRNSSPLKLIMSDGFPTRYKEMKRHHSACSLWPYFARISQRSSNASLCIFRPSCSFFQLPCTLSLPDIIKNCVAPCKTYLCHQSARKENYANNEGFFIFPLLLSNYIQVMNHRMS